MTALLYVFEILFVFVCIFLVLLILIQKGRGGGLASAFGGAGGQTAFGSKTGDVLTWATSVVFGIFLTLAVVLNLIANAVDKAHGGGSTPTVALSPADRSSLPKPQLPPEGMPNTTPTTPTAPQSSSMSPAAVAPVVAAAAASSIPTTMPSASAMPAATMSAAPTMSSSMTAPMATPATAPMNMPTTLP